MLMNFNTYKQVYKYRFNALIYNNKQYYRLKIFIDNTSCCLFSIDPQVHLKFAKQRNYFVGWYI